MTSDLLGSAPGDGRAGASRALVVGGRRRHRPRRRRRPAARTRLVDHAARLVALVGSSLPVFWLGLIVLYVFYVRLGWFPGPGRLPPRVDPPPHVTGLYTVDSLLDGDSEPGVAVHCAS